LAMALAQAKTARDALDYPRCRTKKEQMSSVSLSPGSPAGHKDAECIRHASCSAKAGRVRLPQVQRNHS
jgi:hypothetical protein